MIEIFCTESAPGTDTNVTHIAAGTATGLFLALQLADSPTSLSKRGIEQKLNRLDLSFHYLLSGFVESCNSKLWIEIAIAES